jgi:DNA-binding XRE family transcriptional regulator
MDKKTREIIAKNLKKYREERNYTQMDIAIRLNSHKTTIASWEQGRSVPDLDMAYRVMSFYNLTLDDLFKEDE